MKKLAPILVTLIMTAYMGCTHSPTEAKGGSGTEIVGLNGRLVDMNGDPVSGAVVRAYPVDYVPSFAVAKTLSAPAATTDAEGNYALPVSDTGAYNIEAEKDSLGIFMDSIEVHSDTEIVHLPQGILKKLGGISGISQMPGQGDTDQVRVTLYLPGTRRITKPLIGGRFNFDYMPEGKYQMIVDPTLNNYNVKVMDVSVTAGQTLELDTVLIEKFEPDTVDITASSVFGIWGPFKVYRIFTNIVVPNNLSLHIKKGTKILFMGSYGLDVDGSLNVEGDSANLVYFSSGLPLPSAGFWSGIGYYCPESNSIVDSFVLSYSVIEFAVAGAYFSLDGNQAKKVTIKNSVFRYISQYAITLSKDLLPFPDTVRILNSIIHNSGSGAFWGTLGNPTSVLFLNCIFSKDGLENDYYVSFCRTSVPSRAFYSRDSVNLLDWHNCYSDLGPMIIDKIDSIGGIIGAPQFLSLTPGQEDYHLAPTSPCKGTGINGTDMGIYSTYEP